MQKVLLDDYQSIPPINQKMYLEKYNKILEKVQCPHITYLLLKILQQYLLLNFLIILNYQ